MDRAVFFDAVRPHMRGRKLTMAQVEGIEAILDAAVGLPISHIAYLLATAYHETGGRMEPVREGFCKTDAGSRRAVESLFNKGVISWNYALPHAKTGLSYYGRGYVQLTHYGNYVKTGDALKLPLATQPDLMLIPEVSAKAMVWGSVTGAYRGKSLADKLPSTVRPTAAQWRSARGIINGDVRRNGSMVGRYAENFYDALKEAA